MKELTPLTIIWDHVQVNYYSKLFNKRDMYSVFLFEAGGKRRLITSLNVDFTAIGKKIKALYEKIIDPKTLGNNLDYARQLFFQEIHSKNIPDFSDRVFGLEQLDDEGQFLLSTKRLRQELKWILPPKGFLEPFFSEKQGLTDCLNAIPVNPVYTTYRFNVIYHKINNLSVVFYSQYEKAYSIVGENESEWISYFLFQQEGIIVRLEKWVHPAMDPELASWLMLDFEENYLNRHYVYDLVQTNRILK